MGTYAKAMVALEIVVKKSKTDIFQLKHQQMK